jgi:hypothetical protein
MNSNFSPSMGIRFITPGIPTQRNGAKPLPQPTTHTAASVKKAEDHIHFGNNYPYSISGYDTKQRQKIEIDGDIQFSIDNGFSIGGHQTTRKLYHPDTNTEVGVIYMQSGGNKYTGYALKDRPGHIISIREGQLGQ